MSSDDARRRLDRFLHTDPADTGCAQAVEMLHEYVDLVDAGDDPDTRHPGISAHLQACAPCFDDYAGLVITVRERAARSG
jgi:hypothetical protein